MLKAVVDTNVVVSAALSSISRPRAALFRVIERGTLVTSEAMVAEWREVLGRPWLARRLRADQAEELLRAMLHDAVIVHPGIKVRDCRDAKDDKVLECALAAAADLIVSGDRDLLVLHPWRGIPILSPAAYLAA